MDHSDGKVIPEVVGLAEDLVVPEVILEMVL